MWYHLKSIDDRASLTMLAASKISKGDSGCLEATEPTNLNELIPFGEFVLHPNEISSLEKDYSLPQKKDCQF